jgi:aldose 1-epimerase
MVPNWNGRMEDVVLGFDNIDDYHNIKQNFGATVGRYVGRITGPQFKLDGQVYQLQDDGRGHISHGGTPGFQDRVWNVIIKEKSRVVMQYTSPDGENGFPGNLTVTLTYTLTDQNALDVDFKASTDKPTVLNLTNHSFFNICGDLTRQVLTQDLWIDSKRIATYDQRKNLNGKFRKVKHTPFDFTEPRQIGTRIHRDDEQLNITDGYDHSFILRHPGNQRKPAAVLYDAQSGRTLTVYTTEPAIHVYTANGLKGKMVGKGGIAYGKQTAVCLETMHLSDSPNRSNFPSTVLRPGQTFHSKTVFRFSTDTKVLMKEK